MGVRPHRSSRGPAGRGAARVVGAALCLLASSATAQTLPGPAYHSLVERGHRDLAERLEDRLALRARPDAGDVRDVLRRWEEATGGPAGAWEWLTVARLWVRAERPREAADALARADTSALPPALPLLERARIAFLEGRDAEGARSWWRACEVADAEGAREAWLDLEPLATPEELERWDRFRRLPGNQRDHCRFFRRFWNRRALASALPVDERLARHYERLGRARRDYRRRTGRSAPTWSNRLGRPRRPMFDDRGLLYLRMGEPTATTSYQGPCVEANVTWVYEYPDETRLYHFSSLGGVDDWWLLENLGQTWRCGRDGARNQFVTVPSQLGLLPPGALAPLYLSRAGFDTRYQEIAHRDAGVSRLQELAREREWTAADAGFAVAGIPDRPRIDPRSAMTIEFLQFRAPRPGLTRVWLNALLEAEPLRAVGEEGERVYRVRAVWSMLDEDGLELRRFVSEVEAAGALSETAGLEGRPSVPVRLAAELPPGEYRYGVALADAAHEPREGEEERPPGSFETARVTLRDLGGDLPLLSDVAVAADSGGAWSPDGRVHLRATPAHATGPDGLAWLYYEVYNLTPGGTYRTRVRLVPAGGGEAAFDVSFPGETPESGRVRTPVRLRLDLRDTPRGEYTMTVTVTDRTTGRVTLPARTSIRVDHALP